MIAGGVGGFWGFGMQMGDPPGGSVAMTSVGLHEVRMVRRVGITRLRAVRLSCPPPGKQSGTDTRGMRVKLVADVTSRSRRSR